MTRNRPFVVLRHTGHGPAHFDLMIALDDAGPLLTWRCPVWPIVDAAACEPLPPHRRIYLEYEGVVSGGRGEVRRVDRGEVAVVVDDPATLGVVFDNAVITLRK